MPDWWRVDSLAPFVIVILLVKEAARLRKPQDSM